jgi:hypothetical protein
MHLKNEWNFMKEKYNLDSMWLTILVDIVIMSCLACFFIFLLGTEIYVGIFRGVVLWSLVCIFWYVIKIIIKFRKLDKGPQIEKHYKK